MADNTQAIPMPSGATPMNQSGSSAPPTAIPMPAGATPFAGSSVSDTQSNPDSQNTDQIHLNPGDSPLVGTAKTIGGALEGAGEGVFSTVAGAADLANKIPGVHIPTQTLHHLAGDTDAQGNPVQRGTAQQVGYGGETLMEFLLGDEALKGAALSDKLLTAGRVAKTLENSPKLMKAVQVGADALRAGTVQGAQTLVRTGGDVHQAVKEGGTMAGVSAVLSPVVGAAGKIAESLGKGGETVKELSSQAANAPDKAEVATKVQDAINSSEEKLHQNYEQGITDLKDRLSGEQLDPKQVPLAERAKQLLHDVPPPDEHEAVAKIKQVGGDRLDKGTREFLEMLASGEKPAKEGAEEAPKIVLTDADPAEKTAPKTEPVKPYTVDDLIDLRQAIRKEASSYPEMGDVNARTLRQLLPAVDDTIGKLADATGDDKAVQDYANLRKDYGSKINIYNDPVIKNLRAGKMDDASRAFLSGNKGQYNADNLRTILGDEGMNQFSHDVFKTMLRDSTDKAGNFNPAQLLKAWQKVPEETRTNFFSLPLGDGSGATTPVGVSGEDISELMKDAKTAANIQHLTRTGLLGAAGGAVGSHFGGLGIGTLLGLTVGEGAGGFTAGRELLDYLANHPAVWAAYRGVGKAAASPVVKTAVDLGKAAAGQAASGAYDKRMVYNGASSALSGP